jgi:hypothetical protein
MTGSTAVLIAVPIVALSALAFWLGLVYHVGAHPEWKAHRLAREAQARQAQARELAAAVAADRAALRDPGRAAQGEPVPGQPTAPGGGGQQRINLRAA